MLRCRFGLALLAALTLLTSPMSWGESPASPNADTLWPRIIDGMALGNNTRKEVVQAAQTYGRHPTPLINTFVRSSPYLWHIVDAVAQRNMPMEIALLPAIESGFDTDAHSHRLAAGLWQFMPATARRYGLQDAAGYNARRDPIASTQAALNYLDRLHDEYGDWLLALAAYNAGTLRVNRDIQKAHSRNFWALRLPKETRRHIANLLGMALVVRHPEHYGLRLPAIPDKPVTEQVTLEAPRDVARAAEQIGIPHESLAEYNPGLRSLGNTSAQRTLLMLSSDADKLRAELARADYPPAATAASATEPIKVSTRSSKRHRVASGETLWSIARRYGVTVDQLRRWNRLHGSQLKRGRLLIVAAAE